MAKLRRGVYFVAWRGPDSDPLPSWRRYRILATEPKIADRSDGPTEQVRYARMVRRRTELAATDLTYVMVSVDYAGQDVIDSAGSSEPGRQHQLAAHTTVS